MLIPHLDPEGMACELERRRRVADALRAAELRIGSTDGVPGARRPLDIPGQVVRLIGWLRRRSPVRKVAIQHAVIRPSGPVTGP